MSDSKDKRTLRSTIKPDDLIRIRAKKGKGQRISLTITHSDDVDIILVRDSPMQKSVDSPPNIYDDD